MSEEGQNKQPPVSQKSEGIPAGCVPSLAGKGVCVGKGSDGDDGGKGQKTHQEQWMKILMCSTGTWSYGFMTAFTSVLAADLSNNTTTLLGSNLILSDRQLDILNSLLIVGAFFGNLAISPIMSFAGRRPSVILATLFVLTSWLGVALIPSYSGILAARVIGGLGCGALDVAVVTFLAELSPTRKRGMATGMAGAGSMWGQLVMFGMGCGNRYFTVAGFAMLVTGFVVPMMLLLPESPAFLALKGKKEEARKVLKLFRGASVDVDAEIARYITSDVNAPGVARWRRLLEPDVLVPMLITVTLFILTFSTGGTVLITNSSRILRMTHSPLPNNLTSVITMAVQMGACGVYLCLVDRIGRKPTLLLSYLMMSTAMGGFTAYEYVSSFGVSSFMNSSSQTNYFEGNITNLILHDPSLTAKAADQYPGEIVALVMERQYVPSSWIPLVCLAMAQAAYAMGLFSVPYLLANENFPSLIRPQACSICVCAGTLSSIVNLQIFTPMLETLTLLGLFGIYTTASIFGFIFTLVFLKETKNKLLS